MQGFVSQVAQTLASKHSKLSVAALSAAVARMEGAATELSRARDRAVLSRMTTMKEKQVNDALLQVERQLTRQQGLVTRPWFRNLIYAADENNGYSTMVLPSVNEAIRAGDETTIAAELADLAQRFDAATRSLRMATGLLLGD
jgi:N-acetylated-alpha-linked acidic dipeptidase